MSVKRTPQEIRRKPKTSAAMRKAAEAAFRSAVIEPTRADMASHTEMSDLRRRAWAPLLKVVAEDADAMASDPHFAD